MNNLEYLAQRIKEADLALNKSRLDYNKNPIQVNKVKFNNDLNRYIGLLEKIKKYGQGTFIQVKYSLGEYFTYEETFTNITKDEVVKLIELYASLHRVSYKILDYKETKTQCKKVQL